MHSDKRMLQNNFHFFILQVLLIIKSQDRLENKGNIQKEKVHFA